MITNKNRGTSFEQKLAKRLFKEGYWVLPIPQTADGQAADLLAVKHGTAYLIDCKVCLQNTFSLSRIEPNQEAAMNLWRKSADNGTAWFALYLEQTEQIYFISHVVLRIIREKGQKKLSEKAIKQYGLPVRCWVGNK